MADVDETDPDMDPGFTQARPPFATVDDLADRWHAFTDEERPHMQAKLEDAGVVVMGLCPDWQLLPADVLRVVVCGMVKRALINEDTGGVSQSTQTANGFSEALTYANPMGDLYPNQTERKLLGIDRQRMFSIDMSTRQTAS